MFNPSDKVIRVGSTSPNSKNVFWGWAGKQPSMGKVYVVSDCWNTPIGPQLMLVGFGPAPILNGKKTGWACKYFRLLDEVKAENKQKSTVRKTA